MNRSCRFQQQSYRSHLQHFQIYNFAKAETTRGITMPKNKNKTIKQGEKLLIQRIFPLSLLLMPFVRPNFFKI